MRFYGGDFMEDIFGGKILSLGVHGAVITLGSSLDLIDGHLIKKSRIRLYNLEDFRKIPGRNKKSRNFLFAIR